MAKKKKEEVVEKTTNEPKGDVTKIKAEMQKPGEAIGETITKVDLSNPPKPKEDEVKESDVDNSGVVDGVKDADTPQKQEEVQPEVQAQETPVLEEVTEEDTIKAKEEIIEAIVEAEATGKPLPENIQHLVDFMEDTGGDLNDYVKLNKDYSEMDNQTLLQEYYKETKPHLTSEEVEFIMEDKFSYDEDVDEDRDIKRKKLALKEQVADAKEHLDGLKSKYYQDIKMGSKLTNTQKEAIEFHDRYQKESKETERLHENQKTNFLNKTNRFFGDKFKGFEYNVGDKNFRFNVNNVDQVKEKQSDITNFIGKFLDKNDQMADEAGYHKGLFTAMNPDVVAKHFYEQGKADAIKHSVTSAKNINMDPRQELASAANTSGIKVKVLGDTTADFKFKIKNKR